MNKIVILNGNHLCHNPRVVKEADCLAAAGYDVEVLGAWLIEDLVDRDRELMGRQRFRYTPVVRLNAHGSGLTLDGTILRGRRWTALKAKRWLGLELPAMLGYGVGNLLQVARSRDANLYIAHSEAALWVVNELAREGRKVGVDMEDWFSRDLPPDAQRNRPVGLLQALEANVLAASVHRTCTSQAMSAALAAAYGCPEPLVIYNAFPWSDRVRLDGLCKDRRNPDVPSIHWFSQSIGPGRGLEDLFAALKFLEVDAEVHLRGTLWDGYRGWLERSLPAARRSRVFFHPLVSNDELPSRIAEHDIGVSLDPDAPESRNVTVTNKILQYMQAGLAVVATSTLGQREIASQAPAAVRLCRPGDPAGLADCLKQLLTGPSVLAEAKRASLAAARDLFCWEKFAPRMVASVERAVASRP